MSLEDAGIDQIIERIFRQDAGRVLANLISTLHDFDLAEDVLQEAFIMALQHWPKEGTPANPAAWLTTTARRKAIDRLRRAKVLAQKAAQLELLNELIQGGEEQEEEEVETIPDERLKLIFTCCHPALPLEGRVALTLHTLGGLKTSEIASAFLISETTMAQRLVRAKRKIKEAGIPYYVPPAHLLAERVQGVLLVIYLIFNEGYSSHSGESLMRPELCAEAIRLCRAVIQLSRLEPALAGNAEAIGLLALMLLNDARRAARTGPNGVLVLLEEQDRDLWDKKQIEEGLNLLEVALRMHLPGPYQIQAAISALHAQAERPEDTDWLQIAALYGELLKLNPSPIIELNRAVAIAMADGPLRGLALLRQLENNELLQDYYLFHATRADLLRRIGRFEEAALSYQKALELTQNSAEQIFLKGRLAQINY